MAFPLSRLAVTLVLATALGCARRAPQPDEPVLAASTEPAGAGGPLVTPPAWTPRPGADLDAAVTTSVGRPPEGAVPPDAVLSLRRTACFGTCPEYLVELHADGRVVFVGESHVRVAKAERRIPREAAEKIFASLARIGFWEWNATYLQPITDHPSAIVAVTWGKSAKTVEEYPPCNPESGAPPALCALGKAIDDAAKTAEWTTCKNASGRVVPCSATLGADARGGGCSPPYTVDAKGMKHFKPECLER